MKRYKAEMSVTAEMTILPVALIRLYGSMSDLDRPGGSIRRGMSSRSLTRRDTEQVGDGGRNRVCSTSIVGGMYMILRRYAVCSLLWLATC